ncbi:LppP/LprE family lipoprotein [Mycobacterium sp. NPDC003449]
MIEGGTGSSPVAALMFHRGTFLGTGTSKAYGFTSLDADASTGDTVVLRYRSGQSCTACGDGTVSTVRYHWNGTKVDMLDPPPPQ